MQRQKKRTKRKYTHIELEFTLQQNHISNYACIPKTICKFVLQKKRKMCVGRIDFHALNRVCVLRFSCNVYSMANRNRILIDVNN